MVAPLKRLSKCTQETELGNRQRRDRERKSALLLDV